MLGAIQLVVPGSIIANPGFVQTFGTIRNSAGALVLNPQHVAAWGGIQSGGQICGMWTGPFISDRYGRKSVMYALTVILTVAVIVEITAKNWRVYIAARFLAGLGTGLMQSGVTVYIGEVR